MSSRATPSPSAYMRPSFQRASDSPPWAANCSASTEFLALPERKESSPSRSAWREFLKIGSGCVDIAVASGPSSASVGALAPAGARLRNAASANSLDIGIDVSLTLRPRMRNGAGDRRSDRLRVFPQRAGAVIGLRRSPIFLTLGKFRIAQSDT